LDSRPGPKPVVHGLTEEKNVNSVQVVSTNFSKNQSLIDIDNHKPKCIVNCKPAWMLTKLRLV